jgi:hypothetical protein
MAEAELADLPVFDLAVEGELGAQCAAMAQCIHETGCLVVRDARVTEEDNVKFVDMMQRYYAQSKEAKMADARPDIHYQVGVTPEFVETAKCAGAVASVP